MEGRDSFAGKQPQAGGVGRAPGSSPDTMANLPWVFSEVISSLWAMSPHLGNEEDGLYDL